MIKISIQTLAKITKLSIKVLSLLFVLNALVLIIGHLTGHFSIYGVLDWFNFDRELSIPSYFSALILLLSSLLLYTIYLFHKNNGTSDSKYWCFLSIIFLCLSIDEASVIHETFGKPMRQLFDIQGGFFYFAWVIPGILICLALLAFLTKFYLNLPKRYKVLFGISALLFIGGAIGMEVLDGLFAPPEGMNPTVTYSILTTIEETLEMTGIILFNYSLIDYLKSDMQTITYDVLE